MDPACEMGSFTESARTGAGRLVAGCRPQLHSDRGRKTEVACQLVCTLSSSQEVYNKYSARVWRWECEGLCPW